MQAAVELGPGSRQFPGRWIGQGRVGPQQVSQRQRTEAAAGACQEGSAVQIKRVASAADWPRHGRAPGTAAGAGSGRLAGFAARPWAWLARGFSGQAAGSIRIGLDVAVILQKHQVSHRAFRAFDEFDRGIGSLQVEPRLRLGDRRARGLALRFPPSTYCPTLVTAIRIFSLPSGAVHLILAGVGRRRGEIHGRRLGLARDHVGTAERDRGEVVTDPVDPRRLEVAEHDDEEFFLPGTAR